MDRTAAREPGGVGPWRLAVVEDHLLQRRATVALLEAQRGLRVVREAETLPAFVTWWRGAAAGERPHLLLLDLLVDRGPSVDPSVVRQLVQHGLRVVVFSAMSSPPLVRRVLRAGVSAVVGKRDSEDDLVAAVWTVLGQGRWMSPELDVVLAGAAGRPVLSDQEERALVLYASGLTLAAVAEELGVKQETAKTYLNRVRRKYEAVGRTARSKVDLTRIAMTDGYLDPRGSLNPRRRTRRPAVEVLPPPR